MSDKVKDTLVSPRTWLALGAFCVGASLVVGYHEEHRSAQTALYERVGLPEEVLIQNFAPDLHSNLIGQIRVVGEVVPGQVVAVNLGTGDTPHWVDAQPIYPVGREMLPFFERHRTDVSGAPRRPVPRTSAAEIERLQSAIGSFADHAFAFAVIEADGVGAGTARGIETVVSGDDRDLVTLTGAMVSGSSLRDRLSRAVLDAGIPSTPDTLIVQPRASEAVQQLLTRWQADQLRVWLASAGILAAFVALIAPGLGKPRAQRAAKSAGTDTVAAAHAFPAVSFFQPIATQDELSHEEMSGIPGRKRPILDLVRERLASLRLRSLP